MRSHHVALWIGLLALGCAHAKTTDQEKTTAAKPAETKAHSGGATKPRAPHRDPSDIPVASSAQGLLKPGAEGQIRDKLVARGFMDQPADGAPPPSLRAPLERFQDANDLPATGAPDAETIRKLGLDPDAVLRKATSAQPDEDRAGAKTRPPGDVPE
jgi:peptidoglycan hydrolase-like protein with peptidoglycan-binding domain